MKNIPVRKIRRVQGEPSLSSGFSIRRLQDLLAGKDLVQELHRHDHYFILALEKGAGRHVIDFVPQPVAGRTVFLLRPGQVHELTLQSGSTGYLLLFNPDFFSPENLATRHVLRKAGHTSTCRLPEKGFARLNGLLNEIFREFTAERESYEEVIRALLGIFFIELVRHRRNRRAAGEKTLAAPERLEAFLELLEKHVSEQKTTSDYAAMLHLSVYQLNAVTRAALGKTSSQLIDEQLVLESKRLLLATANQVKEIAYSLGYEDVSYFIRFFKKHTGYSPEAFRQHFR